MNFRAEVKNVLDSNELVQAKALFEQTEYAAFIQNPEYDQVIGTNALHVLVFDESTCVRGYALVEAKKKLLATISFGPLCHGEEIFFEVVSSCFNALLRYGFKIIRFQPPFINSSTWRKTQENLYKTFPVFLIPSQINWSTLVLDISPGQEILFQSFSENHRRSINKAKKENLKVEIVSNKNQMDGFAEGLCKMYHSRSIPYNLNSEKEHLNNLFSFAVEKGNGLVLVIKKDGNMLGGIILIIHNNKIFYLVGFSDPDYKKIPVNHLLFFESFGIAKNAGCNSFDFGGYGRDDQAGKQVLNINRFKDGFKGTRIDYPDTIFVSKNSFYQLGYVSYLKWNRRKNRNVS